MEQDRWTAYLLVPDDAAGKPRVQVALACPAGKLEALAPIDAKTLPAALEPQAWLLSRVMRQLGGKSPEAYLVTVAEASGGASLYRMPRRNEAGAVRLGQDFRLTYRPGGEDPFTFTRFHFTTWTLALEDGSKAVGMFHNHLDWADPCETDVAAAILDGNVQVHINAKGGYFHCGPDGNITEGTRPEGLKPGEGEGGPAKVEPSKGLRAFSFSSMAFDLENTWIIHASHENGRYMYVCVYLDLQAGFTSQIGGLFTLDRDGRAKPAPDWPSGELNAKVRLDHDFYAAPMPPGIQKDLGLTSPPDFLKFYHTDQKTPETLLARGFHLNHIGECERALAVLAPLYKAQPDLKGLAFELAYAYNALRKMDQALVVLEEAFRRDPKAPYIARELAYSYLHLGRYPESIATYLEAMKVVPAEDASERAEEALNLSLAYDGNKDQANSDIWLAKAKALAPAGSQIAGFVAEVEAKRKKRP